MKITSIILLLFFIGCNHKQKNSPTQPFPTPSTKVCQSNQYYDQDHNMCVDYCAEGEKFDFDLRKCITITPPMIRCTGNSYPNKNNTICIKGKPLDIHTEYSQLEDILYSAYIVCVDLDESAATTTETEMDEILHKIDIAIQYWLEPLNIFPSYRIKNKPQFIKSFNCRNPQITTKIHIYSRDKSKQVCGGVTACVTQATHTIHLTADADQGTCTHEYGHILGFKDYYNEPNPLKAYCKEGYDMSTTIMCESEDGHLKSADIDGIRDLYCALFHDRESDCQTNYHLPIKILPW